MFRIAIKKRNSIGNICTSKIILEFLNGYVYKLRAARRTRRAPLLKSRDFLDSRTCRRSHIVRSLIDPISNSSQHKPTIHNQIRAAIKKVEQKVCVKKLYMQRRVDVRSNNSEISLCTCGYFRLCA